VCVCVCVCVPCVCEGGVAVSIEHREMRGVGVYGLQGGAWRDPF
jgi:hypothetical protein